MEFIIINKLNAVQNRDSMQPLRSDRTDFSSFVLLQCVSCVLLTLCGGHSSLTPIAVKPSDCDLIASNRSAVSLPK